MDRKDWTLLAIAAAAGESLNPAQLQKSLFVLRRECSDDVGCDFHEFSPYHYGPFAASVYHDAEELADQSLVEINTTGSVPEYRATSGGLEAAQQLYEQAPDAVRYLKRVVKWARGRSFQALVRAIYDKYPEQRENSVFSG